MRQQLFTPASAARALETVRPVAERICLVYRALEARRPIHGGSDRPVDPAYFRLLAELYGMLERLAACGVRIRDPRRGAVDFPARRAGRRVMLSWRVGESSLRYWRELGAERRRPVQCDDDWTESGPTGESAG